jgi:hypothetical protein
VLRADSGEAGPRLIEKKNVDLMMLGVRLRGINDFKALKIVKGPAS